MSKLIVTIGPATENTLNLKYILSKTKLVRLNFSHNSVEWH